MLLIQAKKAEKISIAYFKDEIMKTKFNKRKNKGVNFSKISNFEYTITIDSSDNSNNGYNNNGNSYNNNKCDNKEQLIIIVITTR